VWLTELDENPNGAQFLFLTDGAASERMAEYERCFELFDGNDEAAVEAARGRWKEYAAAGFGIAYWQQGPNGGWQSKD
jgi:DNA polymerase-3 subunit chi